MVNMRLGFVGVLLCACGPVVAEDGGTGDTNGSTGTSSATLQPTVGEEAEAGGMTLADSGGVEVSSAEVGESGLDIGTAPCMGGECPAVDVLFVIDNSGQMADEQLALTQAAVRWVGSMLLAGSTYDVQVMVTTTDFGNPLCTQFQPPGYAPARGAPTSTGCNARIADFTGLGSNPEVRPDVCTSVCPSDIAPADPFVAIAPGGSNVPDVPAVDVDGDGVSDGPEAQALACLLPQGISGCGYESPLETMLQALNPDAPWNASDRPFLRDGARLAIVVLTDELDCSVQDYSVMENQAYYAINPSNGTPMPSSALCWNAGVACVGPDVTGVYTDCAAVDGPLHETSRYTTYLLEALVGNAGKRVDMFTIVGVPPVTAYAAKPPFSPTAGGLPDLVVRDWNDGPYPAGDLVPDDIDAGLDAADKQFLFGIGPGCTGELDSGAFTQAVPNPRVVEVCQALDGAEQHCFVDSICAPTYDGVLETLLGTMQL